ncbi:hypothetical protein [Caldalkalibacillus mannanilyticus]|uniref:hypothetical protein n=1 Tax=Caldalkalibacillus mannanilyticus TaxID=1418 RepID=UPI000469BCC0|nr:hypothetical protein [Caldalkalibacillus mannanilyticus]
MSKGKKILLVLPILTVFLIIINLITEHGILSTLLITASIFLSVKIVDLIDKRNKSRNDEHTDE